MAGRVYRRDAPLVNKFVLQVDAGHPINVEDIIAFGKRPVNLVHILPGGQNSEGCLEIDIVYPAELHHLDIIAGANMLQADGSPVFGSQDHRL